MTQNCAKMTELVASFTDEASFLKLNYEKNSILIRLSFFTFYLLFSKEYRGLKQEPYLIGLLYISEIYNISFNLIHFYQ